MTTNIKEAITLIMAGTLIMIVSYILLFRQNDIKNDILNFRTTEKTLLADKEPLTRVIEKYRSAYKTSDELIPNKVMETLDSLYQKTTLLTIFIDKARSQIRLYESTVDWLNIIIATLFISGMACLSLGVVRYLR